MTRSIGDMIAQSIGVIAKPEITRFELSVTDKVLVMASDGLWDRMSNSEVIQTILPFYKTNDAENAASNASASLLPAGACLEPSATSLVLQNAMRSRRGRAR